MCPNSNMQMSTTLQHNKYDSLSINSPFSFFFLKFFKYEKFKPKWQKGWTLGPSLERMPGGRSEIGEGQGIARGNEKMKKAGNYFTNCTNNKFYVQRETDFFLEIGNKADTMKLGSREPHRLTMGSRRSPRRSWGCRKHGRLCWR